MTSEKTRSATRRANRGNWFWSRVHFLLRLLGLLGFLAICIGLVLARGIDHFFDDANVAFQTLFQAVRGQAPADPTAKAGVYEILGGSAALLLVLLVEVMLVVRFVAARRSLMGVNAAVQVVLAVVLLIGVNVYAFEHAVRWDCTRNKEFTLPDAVLTQLHHLKGETLIVVHVRPDLVTGPVRDPKVEAIEKEAQKNVIERVQDLADQFRQAGPQFRVVVLDVSKKEEYQARYDDVTKGRDKLREAINATPESSIFFYANNRVQQLSFKEFALIDLPASKVGRGNLVLLTQGEGPSGRGVETFARKIFNVDERKPRIGVLVVHDLLTTGGNRNEFTHRGLRKTLEEHGFEVRDVVLWKNLGSRAAEPVAYTPDEQRLVMLENRLAFLNARIRFFEIAQRDLPTLLKELKAPLTADEGRRLLMLSRQFFPLLQGQVLLPQDKEDWIEYFERRLQNFPAMLAEKQQERDKVQKDIDDLRRQGVDLGLHISDVNAKLKSVLAECDMLYIPRLTRRDPGDPIPYRIHRLTDEHLAAIKDFLRSGKPVLSCVGPLNEPPDADFPPDPADRDDNLEKLFAELGVRLAPQTVLFSGDSQEIADYKLNGFLSQTTNEVPPVAFESKGAWIGYRPSLGPAAVETPNPLGKSLEVTARSAGAGFALNIRFARPVYYDPTRSVTPPAAVAASHFGLLTGPGGTGPLLASTNPPWKVRRAAERFGDRTRPAEGAAQFIAAAASSDLAALGVVWSLPVKRAEPTFLYTATGWNENNPFAEDEFGPSFEPPKPNDPANGTLDERRRGSFPIGVAVEAPVPASWGSDSGQMVRVAVIGQGDVFSGLDLPAPKQQLLLQTTNWLLGREDLLPRDDHVWRYPRVEYSPAEKEMYLWGLGLGLPALFPFLGFVVLLARRVR